MSAGWDPSSVPNPVNPPYPPYAEAAAYAIAHARTRVNMPGVLLIVTGTINFLLALYLIFNGVFIWTSPEAKAELANAYNKAMEQQQNAGPPPLTLETFTGLVYGVSFGGGAVALVLSVLIFLAGLRMRHLQSYGLALMSSILAAVPCLSCSGCFLFGQIAGIWALVVLLDPAVRMSFHAASLPPGMYPLPTPTPQQPINPTDHPQPGGQP